MAPVTRFQRACSLAALALTQYGDSVVTTAEELEAIVSGQTGGLLR
jgi:hypothetical protein